MKITVHFLGDWDAGIHPYSYEAEVPEPYDGIDREEVRKYVKEFYETLTGDKSTWTIFEDEKFNDDGALIKEVN